MNFQHKAYSIIPVFFSVVIGLSCGLSAPLSAEEKPAKKIPTQSELPWEHSAAAGFSFASGNSDSISYNLRFLSTFRTDDADAFIGADYFYSRDFGQDTNNTLQIRGAYDRLISKRFYLGLNASLLTNEASDIDYRLDLSPVLGYYFIRNERGLLSAEIGPGYAFESRGGTSDSFATLRLAQHFDYRWNEVTRIRQSASLTPRADDAASSIFELSAGLDLRINDRWDIQPRIIHRLDLSPAFGTEKSDTLITLGFAYSLNGFLKEELDRDDERKTLREKDLKTEGNRKGWVRNLGLAATSSSGNSNSLNLNLNFETIFRSDERDFLLRANYLFAETSNKTSQNRFRANASHSWKFNKRTYAGINTNFAYDASTDLDYRMTPGVHAGYYPLLTDYGGLSFEGGLGYTFQQEGNIVNNASSFYLAQRLYWQIGYHTYITQEISYQAFLEDVTDFNISSYLFLDTFLTKDLSWRIGLQYFYDGTPPSGLKSSDLSLLSGISVTF